jgi:hypothetical protein
MMKQLTLLFVVLALSVTTYVNCQDDKRDAGRIAISSQERMSCEALKGYMDKYKSILRQSQGVDRERRIADLKAEYRSTVDKLPARAKSELGTWEQRCAILFDMPTGDTEKKEEELAVSFGVLYQACGGTLRP